jgi:hypothetical protein
MSKRSALRMTAAQVEEHQRKHGFEVRHVDLVRIGEDFLEMPHVEKPKIPRSQKMTRGESEYELILRARFPDAKVLFQAYTLRLADDCRYTPDFAVVHHFPYQVDFYEVKGRNTPVSPSKSLVKPRVAAEHFPQHRFFVAQKLEHGWEEVQFANRNAFDDHKHNQQPTTKKRKE